LDTHVTDFGTAFGENDRSTEELVCTVPELGLLAINHGIREAIEMAYSYLMRMMKEKERE
jgi:hypothetical protein|tara:strand:- start:346 stop:525 length:180 start_codon:yes stop_codon:yes gene_type:complete